MWWKAAAAAAAAGDNDNDVDQHQHQHHPNQHCKSRRRRSSDDDNDDNDDSWKGADGNILIGCFVLGRRRRIPRNSICFTTALLMVAKGCCWQWSYCCNS